VFYITGNSNKKVFSTPLQIHLDTNERKISYVIELCVCCLLEKGLREEGLLRVGCGKLFSHIGFHSLRLIFLLHSVQERAS
jgi:hypothetical protein